MGTVRQVIRELLLSQEMGVRELAQATRLNEKDIVDHLSHIERSIKKDGLVFKITEGECSGCGFVFKGRSRFTKPGKCPECRHTKIFPPGFRLIQK